MLHAGAGGECRHSTSTSLLERPGEWLSQTPNQWKNRGPNDLLIHPVKQGDAGGLLPG